MGLETTVVAKTTYNPNMGRECHDHDGVIFFIDNQGWDIKSGDIIMANRNDRGFYEEVWVNWELKTKNLFNLTHGIE